MEKKRLLKDLPFENDILAGTVICKGSRGTGTKYTVTRGSTYYGGGGSSSNGLLTFTEPEEDIIDAIWDKKNWFEPAELKHIDFVPKSDSITLRFKNIDREDAENLMKGLIHILPQMSEKGYAWSEFSDITTAIKNN